VNPFPLNPPEIEWATLLTKLVFGLPQSWAGPVKHYWTAPAQMLLVILKPGHGDGYLSEQNKAPPITSRVAIPIASRSVLGVTQPTKLLLN
jgi:hypothetical protein